MVAHCIVFPISHVLCRPTGLQSPNNQFNSERMQGFYPAVCFRGEYETLRGMSGGGVSPPQDGIRGVTPWKI